MLRETGPTFSKELNGQEHLDNVGGEYVYRCCRA